jgi:signal peptidase II
MTTAATGDSADDKSIDDDDEIIDDDEIDGPTPGAPAWRRPTRRRWVLFAALAVGVLVLDQVTKAWITGTFQIGGSVEVLGSWLRIVHWRNSGILFGMLPQSAPAFAFVSLVVVGLIVVYHAKAGRGLVTTLALGLLLGGALGNLVDRLRYGSVVDWVDMGIGDWRFYTYNMGDAAITTAITMLLLMAVFPRLADWAAE